MSRYSLHQCEENYFATIESYVAWSFTWANDIPISLENSAHSLARVL